MPITPDSTSLIISSPESRNRPMAYSWVISLVAGLGAAPTTLALLDQDAVREVLNLPDNFAAMCLIPVGYPLGKFGPVPRKPVDEIMRFDRWS